MMMMMMMMEYADNLGTNQLFLIFFSIYIRSQSDWPLLLPTHP